MCVREYAIPTRGATTPHNLRNDTAGETMTACKHRRAKEVEIYELDRRMYRTLGVKGKGGHKRREPVELSLWRVLFCSLCKRHGYQLHGETRIRWKEPIR